MSVKIAIVEDNHAIASMYKFRLEQEDMTVGIATNGEEGLKLVKDFQPDLILLDLKMPVMSGDEMLEKLRASDWGANMRVVVLTNISRDEAPHKLRLLNVDRYVVKAHTTPHQVCEIIKEILAKNHK